MIKNGAVNEVRKFLKLNVPKAKSVNKAIGIQEIKDILNSILYSISCTLVES